MYGRKGELRMETLRPTTCGTKERRREKKCFRLASMSTHESSSRSERTKPRHIAVIIDLGASLHFAFGRVLTGLVQVR